LGSKPPDPRGETVAGSTRTARITAGRAASNRREDDQKRNFPTRLATIMTIETRNPADNQHGTVLLVRRRRHFYFALTMFDNVRAWIDIYPFRCDNTGGVFSKRLVTVG
jgi:hypothetical protein